MFDINSLRTDPEKSSEGTWVGYRQGASLKVARLNNKEAEQFKMGKALENADVFQAGGEEAEKLAEQVEVETLAHYVLKDWDGFTKGGEELEYTPELGMEILSNAQFADFRDDLVRIAQNREHFRVKAEEAATQSVKKAAAS